MSISLPQPEPLVPAVRSGLRGALGTVYRAWAG